MRYRTGAVVVAVAAFLAGTAPGASGQALGTDQAKTSYAVGVQMGRDMKRFKVNLNPDDVAKGFKDAYRGTSSF